MSDLARANQLHAEAIVARVVAAGVEHAFVAPGSRSTPLVAAAVRAGVPMTLVVDERAAGFAAIGAARTGRTACVITTSGTAVANLLPAACEADADELPWVALTADRPVELVGVGANQTLDQPPLLAGPARAVVDLAAPPAFDGDFGALEEGLAALVGESPGPVHVNARFDKPLEPVDDRTPYQPCRWTPPARAERPRPPAPFEGAARGVVVVGALPPEVRRAVEHYLTLLPWPALVDVTSGLDRSASLRRFPPALLRATRARELVAADRCLWIGGRLTDPSVAAWLGAARVPVTQWRADAAVRDPDGLFTDSHVVDLTGPLPRTDGALASGALAALERCHAALPALAEELSEPFVARTVAEACRADEHLFVGSSMPVRDVDRFARALDPNVLANRGASGIDGNLATAFGAWRASGRPVTALLGDLAFLHDAGTLAALAERRADVRVVVVDNAGGGIFHFLPIAEHAALFEPWFGAPHAVDPVAVARGYGLAARRVESVAELREALGPPPEGPELLVVRTDRVANVALHRELDRRYEAALAEVRA